MILLRSNIIIAGVLLMFTVSGCFEEDKRITPHIPGEEKTFVFERSMYTNQSFFDLGTNSIISENENSVWVLRFASQSGESHININSSDYWGVYNSGTAYLDSVNDKPDLDKWVFDKSSGEPDSSAFTGWVEFNDSNNVYSKSIYLIGKYDGIGYKAKWASQFLSVDDSMYLFRLMSWPGSEWTEYSIPRDPDLEYQYFTPNEGGKVIRVEPDNDLWDLEFTQYGSILYTDDGVPTPYYVRGVLLNGNGVASALDSLRSFSEISFENLPDYSFSLRNDFIGYEWKDVEVDMNSNTAVYTVKSEYTYIIRDTEGFFYKLRFISFYNDLGEKGFPVIEYLRL